MRFLKDGSYRASWIVPVSSPPVQGGYLRIDRGRITHLGTAPPPGTIRHLQDVALLPGLINAHTHLEFSSLTQPLGSPSMPFPAWAEAVIQARSADLPLEANRWEAILTGLDESYRHGVVLVGEIATAPWPVDRLDAARASSKVPQLTLFAEVLGLSPARQEHTWEWALSLEAAAPPGVTIGFSPHAPYSTPPEFVHRIVEHARAKQLPIAMHVAESLEELELLSSGTGPFRSALERMGVWRAGLFPPPGGLDALLSELGRAPRTLVVHGNYLTSHQIAFLAGQRHMSVVYCPRTHGFFGHRRHPIAELWRAGVRVALGTDSRASNPDLSVWNEARFLRDSRPDLDPRDLLRAITADAADSLGRGELGRLEVGLMPGVVAARTTARDERQLLETLFEDELLPT